MTLETIQPRWNDGRTVVVAAPGPSLSSPVAERCRPFTALAIKEAYRLFPWAEVLYGCDEKFWNRYDGCRDFAGERWSSHGIAGTDDKQQAAAKYGPKLVQGRSGHTFSLDGHAIHYGDNSGFQAINLAILFGATHIVLVGFDMKVVNGQRYFCRPHPTHRHTPAY